jgi:alpha-tubulin suppressor-like RCC1 family protein
MWGSGVDGQLGIGPRAKKSLRPFLVRALRSERVAFVACGGSHTLASTEDGRTFAWGSGSVGQLGIGHPTEEEDGVGDAEMKRTEPVLIEDVPKAAKVCCRLCVKGMVLNQRGRGKVDGGAVEEGGGWMVVL